jgi:hypothetical protein
MHPNSKAKFKQHPHENQKAIVVSCEIPTVQTGSNASDLFVHCFKIKQTSRA